MKLISNISVEANGNYSERELIAIKSLVISKTEIEQDAYDEHHTGYAVRCIPLLYFDQLDPACEIPVPEYWFCKLLGQGNVCVSMDGKYLIANFNYDPIYGAQFDTLEAMTDGMAERWDSYYSRRI